MLPERLRKRRKLKKLSQQDMADFLGITRQGYGHYETGRNEPDNETLSLLGEKLECTADYLLGRTDNPKEMLSEELSETDKEFLELWNTFSEKKKQNIIDLLKDD